MNIRSISLFVIFFVIPLFFAYFLLSALPASGQATEGEYIKVDYLDVHAEDEQEFLEIIQSDWKEVIQSRIDKGEITGWQFYKTRFRGDHVRQHNYVIITSAETLAAFEDQENLITDIVSRQSSRSSAMITALNAVKHSELWRVQNSVTRAEDLTPSRFMVMNYMNVALGREYEYQMFEDEVARPLHEDRMEMERMNAWQVYELVMPGGLRYGYNFSTGDFYNNLEHIEFGFTDELIRANHPDVNLREFFETIFSARDLVKRSLWELIDYVQPEPEPES